MPRTCVVMLPLFAVLTLSQPETVFATPPEKASGKMVKDGIKARADGKLLILRETPRGVLIEGPGYHGIAPRITLDRLGGKLTLEGSQANPVQLWEGGSSLKHFGPWFWPLEGVR